MVLGVLGLTLNKVLSAACGGIGRPGDWEVVGTVADHCERGGGTHRDGIGVAGLGASDMPSRSVSRVSRALSPSSRRSRTSAPPNSGSRPSPIRPRRPYAPSVQLAVALIVRAVGGEGANPDRVRRYMQHEFVSVRDNGFSPTHRDADVLPAEALEEYDDDPARDPRQARLQLAPPAADPLIPTLSLLADPGS